MKILLWMCRSFKRNVILSQLLFKTLLPSLKTTVCRSGQLFAGTCFITCGRPDYELLICQKVSKKLWRQSLYPNSIAWVGLPLLWSFRIFFHKNTENVSLCKNITLTGKEMQQEYYEFFLFSRNIYL